MSTPPAFDPRRFKAQERAGFNRIAARYLQAAPARAALADALLDAARLAPGQTVVDLASGPCLLAAEAARRIGDNGRVLATDLAEGMLAEGLRAGQAPGLHAAACDAEALGLRSGCADRVLAGLALFMFPHPERALTEIHRVLRPGGWLALSVWAVADDVPVIALCQAAIARVLPPRVSRPSVFRFGDPQVLADTLRATGFDTPEITPCDWETRFPDPDAVWQAFLDLAGGAAEALSAVPPPALARIRAELAELLAAHRADDGGYPLRTRAWVASARRADAPVTP